MPPTSSLSDPFICRRDDGVAGTAWVHLAGEFDVANAPRVERTLREALCDVSLVVLDLRGLTFMDLTGLRVILDACSQARGEGRELNVLGGPQVERLFALTGTAEAVNTVELSGALQ